MENGEDDDMHMCLVCHTTIKGLVNYVNHKKNECVGKKTDKVDLNKSQQDQAADLNIPRNNVAFVPQKYTNSQQYEPDFPEFSGNATSHGSVIDFETSQFSTQHVDGLNKTASLLYSGPATSHVKPGTLFDEQITATNMNIAATQSHLNMSVPAPLNLSPNIFRTEHTNLTGAGTASSELHEDHGLLGGCISGAHLGSGFGPGITYPVLSSETVQSNQSAIMSDLITNVVNKEDDNHAHASEKVEDFFQSLELMSKNDPRAEKGQPLGNLPISNILSNLTFSSDEEEFSFDFADDVSFDSLSDDSDLDTNTGKISLEAFESSSLKNRPRYRGKWPPGQIPVVNTPRLLNKPSKGGKKFPPDTFQKRGKASGKLGQSPEVKTFTCSLCDVSFSCRFKYSNHFGTVQHKQKLTKQRNDASKTRWPYKSGRGKSFKLIREINKQCEDDPFSQPFTQDQTPTHEKDSEIQNQDNEDLPVVVDSSAEVKNTETEQENINTQNERQDMDLENSEISSAKENSVDSVSINKELDAEQDVEINDDDETLYKTTINDKEVLDSHAGQENGNIDTEPMYRAVPLYICTICDRKYPNKYYLSRHLITMFHRSKAQAQPEEAYSLLQRYHKYIIRLSPYQCAICRFYFNSNEEFLKHLESLDHVLVQANLVAEMMCSLCQYRTHYNEDLLQHVKTEEHMDKIKKRKKICIIKESHIKCKCKYCGLVMTSYTRLKRHVLLKHKDKEFVLGVVKRKIGVRNRPKCSICDIQFASKSTLELHVRRRHTKERPYTCQVCHKEFTDKHALRGHERTSRHLKKVLDSKLIKAESIVSGEVTNQNESWESHEKQSSVKTENSSADSDTDRPNVNENTKDEDKDHGINKSDKKNIQKPKHDENFPMKSQKISKRTGKIKGSQEKKKRKIKSTETITIKDKTYKCNHCSFTVTAYNDLRPHYLKEHAAQTTICELCDIVFLSSKAMKLHILSKEHQANIDRSSKPEKEIKYFECHICGKKFTDEKYCKFHTAYQHFHITTEEGVIKEYGKNGPTREKFKQVLSDIEPLPHTARIECPECKVGFKKSNFLEHLRLHTGEKPFKCKICPKAFMANVTLRKHLLGHFGCQERTCEICNKHFKKVSSYEEHMQVHEAQKSSSEKVHVCDTCGLSFYLERQLRSHLRRHKEREFKCTVPGCHWKFLFANELKYHMRSHSQQKPFLCDICGYAATSKCRLTRHHKTHTGERNYHCEYCSYKAGNSTHLHRHMRIHIGSKPFKCPYCEYSCNTHENMRKHIIQTKKHVGLKIYPCRFCDYATNSCADFRNHLMENHENELGPHIQLMSGLSKFTGLYNKDLDPKQPMEGNKIHQVRERTPRVKKNLVELDDNEKGKPKGKHNKKVKTQINKNGTYMKPQGMADGTILQEGESKSTTGYMDTNVGNSNEIKKDSGFNITKSVSSGQSNKANPAGVSNIQQQRYTIAIYQREDSPKIDKSEVKMNTTISSRSPQTIQVNASREECFEEPSARNINFGEGYNPHSTEPVPKQVVMNINTPMNYRSLLKGNPVTNLPLYPTYNTYSDHQLQSNNPQSYNGPFSANQVHMYSGSRDEQIGMLSENLHRNDSSSGPFGFYIRKGSRPNEQEEEQSGNLILDLGFDKKHC